MSLRYDAIPARFELGAVDLASGPRLGAAAGLALGLTVWLENALFGQAWTPQAAAVAVLFAGAGLFAGLLTGLGLDVAAPRSDAVRALVAAMLLPLLVPPAGAALFALYHAVQPAEFQAALRGAGGTPSRIALGALSFYRLVAPLYLIPGLPVAGLASVLALRSRGAGRRRRAGRRPRGAGRRPR